MKRREFVKKTIIGSAGISAASAFSLTGSCASAGRESKIGIMWGTIRVEGSVLEKFQICKQAGFKGIQIYSHLDRNEVLEASNKTGVEITGVCDAHHWKFLLSSPDSSVREKGRDALKISIEDAKAYGTDTVLLVPGKVDETVSYDDCWKRSIEEISKVLPLAEELNVTIAIENVWNNFILSPVEAIYYLDQFESPNVKFYFDCGNILVYGWPEQWINILGNRIARIHIKEFSNELANTKGKREGFNVKLGEGDVNWPAVMKAMDNTGYDNWLVLEQGGGDSPEGLKDLVERTRKIVAC